MQLIERIQSRLPSAHLIRTALFVVTVLIVLVCWCIIVFHRYKHRFWCDKPVAWASILPSRTGTIQYSPLATKAPPSPPTGLTLLHTQHLTTDIQGRVASLWQCSEGVVRHVFTSTPHTHALLLWSTGDASTTVPTDPTDPRVLVGTIMWAPATLHTPLDQNQPLFVVRRMVVHPDFRGKRLAPLLMESALHRARQQSAPFEPVALFAVPADLHALGNNRLPFSEVARTLTMSAVLHPTLLPDPETAVSHHIVTEETDLPSGAVESSKAHLETKRTLEPDTDGPERRAHWKHIVAHPDHRVVSVGGHDWMHLVHLRGDTPLVEMKGCSFVPNDTDTIANHLLHYVKHQCGEESSVTLVVPQPLQHAVHRRLQEDAQWNVHRAHYLYMYNYRLNPVEVNIPYTMNLDIV